MDIQAIRKTYRRYARVYDFYFGAIFQHGRKTVIDGMNCQPDDCILEVGVGTGLSLPLYPDDVYITGIDLSVDMLEQARARKARDGLDRAILLEMDGEKMTFPDNSFDKVVAMYVASVVPHPDRLVAEMQRVCKPGGELYIVNHFHSSHPLLAGMEKLLAPLSKLLGWRPDLSMDQFLRETDLAVTQIIPVNLFGYWTLLRAANTKQPLREEMVDLMPLRAAAGR
ncbi:MAG: methyltransferase domain-containing protein [Gammaproteobacteria bacterium]|nr:methyltransferase domain-containing protein [Gammaproteobacteria bacterium]MCP5459297.1 methyltransferase domain-containing protein [Gammaproteobacteria bacterium]